MATRWPVTTPSTKLIWTFRFQFLAVALRMLQLATPAQGVLLDKLWCLYNPVNHSNIPTRMKKIMTPSVATTYETNDTDIPPHIAYYGLCQNGQIAGQNFIVALNSKSQSNPGKEKSGSKSKSSLAVFSDDSRRILRCPSNQTETTHLRNTKYIKERFLHVYKVNGSDFQLKHTFIITATSPNDPHAAEFQLKLHPKYSLVEQDAYTLTNDHAEFGEYVTIVPRNSVTTQQSPTDDSTIYTVYVQKTLVYKYNAQFQTFRRETFVAKKTLTEHGWRLSANGRGQSLNPDDVEPPIYGLIVNGQWVGTFYIASRHGDDLIFTEKPDIAAQFPVNEKTAFLNVFTGNQSSILEAKIMGHAVQNPNWDYEFNMTGLEEINDDWAFAVAHTLQFKNQYDVMDSVEIAKNDAIWGVRKRPISVMVLYEVLANAELRIIYFGGKLTKTQKEVHMEYIMDSVQDQLAFYLTSKLTAKFRLVIGDWNELIILECLGPRTIFPNRHDIYFKQVHENVLSLVVPHRADDERLLCIYDVKNNHLVWNIVVKCPKLDTSGHSFEMIVTNDPPPYLLAVFQNPDTARNFKCRLSEEAGNTISKHIAISLEYENGRVFRGKITNTDILQDLPFIILPPNPTPLLTPIDEAIGNISESLKASGTPNGGSEKSS